MYTTNYKIFREEDPKNMSYIHCDHGNYYIPSENLQGLFEELVVQPFENHLQTPAWEAEVRNREAGYHREFILDRGRTNFNEPFNSLSSEDKVLIYCVHYMPMHLFSSYHIFKNHLPTISGKVVFIDFGCGPLTSGIAFWAASAGHRDITYLGIDSSQAMIRKAKEINRYGPNNRRDAFFRNGGLISRYNQLLKLLDDIAERDQTQIIFNFCYFLASHTLDIDNLSNVLIPIVERYSQHKMCVVYQNPSGYQALHQNWETLKSNLLGRRFESSGLTLEQFSYTRLMPIGNRDHDATVDFDILFNESSALSNNPFALPIL